MRDLLKVRVYPLVPSAACLSMSMISVARSLQRRVQIAAAILLSIQVSGMAQQPVRELPAARAALDSSGFEGTIVIYDLAREALSAGHAERIDRRLVPASTFKIFNSLVALETRVIRDQDAVIEWDHFVRDRTELNRDLDFQTAFRISAVPHYQELARRIGSKRMQQFIDEVAYGNRDISGAIDLFWLNGGLRISPREQVDFLVRLYRQELPFSSRTMDIVKEIMLAERTEEYSLRAKTGWAVLAENRNVGWWVGWVETSESVYVFATALEATAPGPSFGRAREALTRTVLSQLGVLRAVD